MRYQNQIYIIDWLNGDHLKVSFIEDQFESVCDAMAQAFEFNSGIGNLLDCLFARPETLKRKYWDNSVDQTLKGMTL